MVYIRSDGSVVQKQSIFRVSIISDVFWAVSDFLWLFVSSLIDPRKPLPKRYEMSSRSGGGGGGGPGGLRPGRPNIHKVTPVNGACSGGG